MRNRIFVLHYLCHLELKIQGKKKRSKRRGAFFSACRNFLLLIKGGLVEYFTVKEVKNCWMEIRQDKQENNDANLHGKNCQ